MDTQRALAAEADGQLVDTAKLAALRGSPSAQPETVPWQEARPRQMGGPERVN